MNAEKIKAFRAPSLSDYPMQTEVNTLRAKVDDLSSLIEVSIIVNSTLNLDEVLNLVMEKAQAVMRAEASSVMLVNPKTEMLEAEIALGEVGQQVKEKIHLKIGEGIAGWVAQTSKPLIVPDVSKDPRFSEKSDIETGFKTRSILAAPLKVRNRMIGVAEVINPLHGKAFTEDDLELFSTFSRQVALAIDNARMHRATLEKQKLDQQLEAARTIQESFLPQTFPTDDNNRFRLAARSIPATQIGGDFFDFVDCGKDALGFVVGDVSGKGIPAALYMARLVSDFRIHSQTDRYPASVLNTINHLLVDRGRRGMFVTLQYVIVDLRTGKVNYANGGHMPLFWIQENGKTGRYIGKGGGAPLGILSESRYVQKSLQLSPGDYLVAYTDGIVEAKNRDGKQYSMQHFGDRLLQQWSSPEELIDFVVDDVRNFTDGMHQQDDLTIFALQWGK